MWGIPVLFVLLISGRVSFANKLCTHLGITAGVDPFTTEQLGSMASQVTFLPTAAVMLGLYCMRQPFVMLLIKVQLAVEVLV